MQGRGRIIAVDLLEMVPLRGVTFLQGDFPRAGSARSSSKTCSQEQKAGLVLSDMSPNISGISGLRPGPGMHLAELALEFARNWLKPDGAFLVKVFQGQGFTIFCWKCARLSMWCPHASRTPRVIAARKYICWAGP
jgi:23S rRNA (uridine2552-2'-O)-methyltransferase